MRSLLVVICAVLLASGALIIWHFKSARRIIEPAVSVAFPSPTTMVAGPASSSSESAFTTVSAHNLLLRKGPDFRVYIPWLRGRMVRTHHDVNPSFDDPESFVLDIETGIIHANIGDIGNFLNTT